MQRIVVFLCLLGIALLLLGASGNERPSLLSCGKHLPPGSQYSVELVASWDRRPESMGNNIMITLKNDETGAAPEALSEELQQLVACARASVGV